MSIPKIFWRFNCSLLHKKYRKPDHCNQSEFNCPLDLTEICLTHTIQTVLAGEGGDRNTDDQEFTHSKLCQYI